MNNKMNNKKPILFCGCFVLLFLGLMISCSSSKNSTPDADTSISVDLPPDPGEEGKTTLAGIDSDDDGVRDDIQRYIVLTYPDEPEIQQALTQLAKAEQDYLLDADDLTKTLENFEQVGRAIDCMYFRAPDEAYDIILKEHAEMLNTRERILANDKASSLLSGYVFTIDKDDSQSCVNN